MTLLTAQHTSTPAVGWPTTPSRASLPRLGVLALAHATNDSYAFVLQAILPAIIGSLGLSLGLAGSLVSLYQITSSFAQPVVGYFADRRSLRWPAWAGVAMSGIGAGLLGLAPNYWTLVLLLVVGGVGTSIFHPVSGAMVGAAAPTHLRGRWMGMYVTAGNFGLGLGPLMLAVLLDTSGPAGAWPIMIPSIALAALVALFAPRPARSNRAMPSLLETLRVHGRLLSSLVSVVTMRSVINTGLITFIPLLGQERGMSLGETAQVLTVYLFAGAVGGLVGGFAADRWGRDRVIVISMLLCVPFGVFVGLAPTAGIGFFAAAAGASFFLNGSFVVLTIRAQESMPGNIAMVSGIMLGLTIGLGGLAVTPLALLAEVLGLSWTTALAACTGVVAAWMMRLVPPAQARAAS